MSEDIVGESGGIPGLVRIFCDDKGRARRVEIDDLVFQKTDKQLISDLFVSALDDMNKKIVEKQRENIRNQPRTSGGLEKLLGLPVTRIDAPWPPLPESSSQNDEEMDDGEDEQ